MKNLEVDVYSEYHAAEGDSPALYDVSITAGMYSTGETLSSWVGGAVIKDDAPKMSHEDILGTVERLVKLAYEQGVSDGVSLAGVAAKAMDD